MLNGEADFDLDVATSGQSLLAGDPGGGQASRVTERDARRTRCALGVRKNPMIDAPPSGKPTARAAPHTPVVRVRAPPVR